MRLITLLALSICYAITVPAQSIQSLADDFSSNNALKHAQVGFSLTDSNGTELASLNSESSLPSASTQKLLTSISALRILGYDHKFVTTVSIVGMVEEGVLHGNVVIKSGGDPTLGSVDFKDHYGDFVQSWVNAVKAEGINEIKGRVLIDDSIFKGPRNAGSTEIDDVGNYYGAGAPGFSFMDNEFTVFFNTRGNGTVSSVQRTEPELPENIHLINEVKAGSVKGDNVIIYSLENAVEIFLKGELPPNRTDFKVRGSIPNVNTFAQKFIEEKFSQAGVPCLNKLLKGPLFMKSKEIHRTKSPDLIEILKILMRKSVNTYADVMLKHIGLESGETASFNGGVRAIKSYWKSKGLDVSGIHLEDGSGLSRKNNLTASFMTSVLSSVSGDMNVQKIMVESSQARSIKSMWGGEPTGFIQAKSGYIGRVRAYSGYLVKSESVYPFHFTVNNYHGSSSEMRKLMGKLLRDCANQLA